jgi:hypothetical protein
MGAALHALQPNTKLQKGQVVSKKSSLILGACSQGLYLFEGSLERSDCVIAQILVHRGNVLLEGLDTDGLFGSMLSAHAVARQSRREEEEGEEEKEEDNREAEDGIIQWTLS